MILSPAAPLTLWIDEDVRVRLRDLSVDGVDVNNASVTWVIRNKSKTIISGSSGTAFVIPSESGGYKGTIPSTITGIMVHQEAYYVDVTIVQGENNGFRRLVCVARYRGSN